MVECTGLENQRGSNLQGFESLLLRGKPDNQLVIRFFLVFKTRARRFLCVALAVSTGPIEIRLGCFYKK